MLRRFILCGFVMFYHGFVAAVHVQNIIYFYDFVIKWSVHSLVYTTAMTI